ncbi:MAG: sigma-70 family RNA polymerase sigma factor [Candidatus Riflebacteria bacterium]|nr:sigma-70 family RNA polymerase sigma factor [Candidatus Riflebacteria bacterium]
MTSADNQKNTDEQLVARILRGEKKLFDVLFDRYIERLLRYVVLFLKSDEEARDLTQEIFIKVFRSLDQYKFMGKFERWLFVIARRTLIDQYRKKKLKTFSFDSMDMDESAIPVQEESPDKAPELLQGLPVRDREILQLRFMENMSYEEISEITGMTQGSLRNVVCRWIRRIQEDNSDELPKSQGMARE